MKSEGFFDQAKAFFTMAQKTAGARRVLDLIRWHQAIPFFVDNKPEFYLEVERGSVKIFPGPSPKLDLEKAFYDESRVYTDSETLGQLFEGRKDAFEAQWEDETIKLLPTGNYAQNTVVLQLFKHGRQEILDNRRREFEEGR